jgi:Putative auto-transporter adhesin, head GIN domain
MTRLNVVPMLLASGLVAIPACGRAESIVVTDGGSVVVINGHVVSGSRDMVVAKGPVRTEHRPLPAYSSIRVDASADVTFSISERPGVAVTAPENVLPLIRTDVSGGNLVIGLQGSVVLSSPIVIAATAPALEAIDLSGSGKVNAAGLVGPQLDVSLGGSGVVTASGNVGHIAIRLSGSGDVDVAGIRATEVSGAISGSGTIRAFASDRVEARISGSGEFIVLGNPPGRATNVSGSGQILFQ